MCTKVHKLKMINFHSPNLSSTLLVWSNPCVISFIQFCHSMTTNGWSVSSSHNNLIQFELFYPWTRSEVSYRERIQITLDLKIRTFEFKNRHFYVVNGLSASSPCFHFIIMFCFSHGVCCKAQHHWSYLSIVTALFYL